MPATTAPLLMLSGPLRPDGGWRLTGWTALSNWVARPAPGRSPESWWQRLRTLRHSEIALRTCWRTRALRAYRAVTPLQKRSAAEPELPRPGRLREWRFARFC